MVVRLQGMTAADFPRFVLPVSSFKKEQDGAVVTIKHGATLAQVLKELVRHHIHRVYEVDDEGKPLLILTLTDVIRLVARINRFTGSAMRSAM